MIIQNRIGLSSSIHSYDDIMNTFVAMRVAQCHGYPTGIMFPYVPELPSNPSALMYRYNGNSLAIYVLNNLDSYRNFQEEVLPNLEYTAGNAIMVFITKHLEEAIPFKISSDEALKDMIVFRCLLTLSTNRGHYGGAYIRSLECRIVTGKGVGQYRYVPYCDIADRLWLPEHENREPLYEVEKAYFAYCTNMLSMGNVRSKHVLMKPTKKTTINPAEKMYLDMKNPKRFLLEDELEQSKQYIKDSLGYDWERVFYEKNGEFKNIDLSELGTIIRDAYLDEEQEEEDIYGTD